MQFDERRSVAHELSIPQPRFVRRLPTVELPPPVEELSAKYLGGQPKHPISELRFETFSTPSPFLRLETNFKTEVCSRFKPPCGS